MRVGITTPCSEDFSKMSPTDQGAHCTKCALNVIDFTDKSSVEIKHILAERIGQKTCGRIESKQLKELNDDFHIWQSSQRRSLQTSFLFATMLVFGLALYGCTNEQEQVVQEFQKQTVQVIDTVEPEPEDTLVKVEKIVIAPPPAIEYIEEEEYLMGDMAYEAVVEEVYEAEIVEKVRQVEVSHTMGAVAYHREFEVYLKDEIQEVKSNRIQEFSALAYPNPTAENATLKLSVAKKEKYQVKLFSITGEFVKDVHFGKLKNGIHELPIDMIDVRPGVYLAVITSKHVNESVRIVKQ